MPYSVYTLSDLISELSLILSDTGNVYWTQPELTYAITEGLREWSADTSFWRARGVFNIAPNDANNPYYDLSVYLPTLRPRSVTIDSICREIQYHLSEPGIGISGTGMTPQFSVNTILQSIQRARNRFVLDAIMPFAIHRNLPITPVPDGRYPLDQNIVYAHRVSWLDSNGIYTALEESDSWAFGAIDGNWTGNPATPLAYSQIETQPLQLQLFPIPIASGLLELITIDSARLDLTNPATTLGIPDDFSHAIKYSAMADLLTIDAETANPFVAQYCLKRYQSIIAAARQHRSALQVLVNNRPVTLTPITSIDRGRPYWRNTPGTPYVCGTLYDLLTFAPVPATNFGVTVDLARSAVIPQSGTDAIQLGQEEIEVIVKYAQHYLSLKLGGDEFAQTFPLYDDFQSSAGFHNGMLDVQARYLGSIFNQAQNEESLRPDAVLTGAAQ